MKMNGLHGKNSKKNENNWELMEKGDNAQPRTSDLPHPSDEGLPGTGGPEKTETIKKITGAQMGWRATRGHPAGKWGLDDSVFVVVVVVE